MEKASTKTRTIKFQSKKNNCVMKVHTKGARDYSCYLEKENRVERYDSLKILDQHMYVHINPIDIRKSYFDISWLTDFVLYYCDGSIGIRELVNLESLFKRATIEKLEFSRRYWAQLKVEDWKIVIKRGDDLNVL